ncbi:hypothetical protein A5740_19210 [Mycobacterium sp. GA-1841]|nr:hypothetical protein A5740_19210 [Mycobacterium sp. GA-1841]
MDEIRCRSGRHVIKSSQDRRPNGGCIRCQRENQRRYSQRIRDKAKMADQLAEIFARPTLAELSARLLTAVEPTP